MLDEFRARPSISIHAPTRGATVDHGDLERFERISIHAPTRGATMLWNSLLSATVFQSTLPREERRSWMKLLRSLIVISIHAPTRGATYI